jgi:hypothetical protein
MNLKIKAKNDTAAIFIRNLKRDSEYKSYSKFFKIKE